jgi:hypothetical protein
MSYADLELASWRRLGSAAAQRLAERIADDSGVELVEVRPHQYAGRPGRIALYRLDGTLYALVPGGEVALGYDGAWFTPTPDQAADYAACPDRLPSDIRQRSWETPEGEKRSVTELEADEVGASLKWATAKVERTSQRGNGDRNQGRERQAERGGDFNEPPPF